MKADEMRMDRPGFTLIELLVTIAIFSLAFSALVTGLRSGIHAYGTVRRHQAL